MARHATGYGARIIPATATALERDGDVFRVTTSTGTLTARSVLLATGVHNRRPDIADDDHADGLRRGLLRYCPICDGYEVTDRRIGVIGTGAHGMREALFLRGFTADVTLIATDAPSAASRFAIAAPMPRDPPVTSAFLP
eukprot:gene50622-68863_t